MPKTAFESQSAHISTYLKKTTHPLLQYGPEHHHTFEQTGSVTVRPQAFQAAFQKGMLDFDQTQYVMQTGMQVLEAGRTSWGRQEWIFRHDNPFDRMSISCEDLTMTSHGPRNISSSQNTSYRLTYQAEYRIDASFLNEDNQRGPTAQAKA
ncbi:hypothetical protein A0U94_05965 [Gluconobacter albidus]|nr:hypothetical protein A0U94_05965 [Gluconobacter albidus]